MLTICMETGGRQDDQADLYGRAGWLCGRVLRRPGKQQKGFVFPDSMLRSMLPLASGLLVRLMFRAGREHPKECQETRIDIDRRLQAALQAW